VWRKEVSFFLLLEANLSPLFPWPTFPHKKINKKKFTKPKNSFKRPQNSIPTMAKKKERKREERGKRGREDLKRIQRRKLVANFMS